MRALRISIAVVAAAMAAWPQTAVFPGAAVTDNQLKVATNNVQTTITFPVGLSDTTILVASGTGIAANSIVTLDNETIAICGVAGTTLTVGQSSCPNTDGRGFDGSIAATHSATSANCNAGTASGCVSLFIDAWHHNAVRKELEAVESFAYQKSGLGSKAGTVVLYPPALSTACQTSPGTGCVGIPVAPNGQLISTVGTTTSGLAEGLNYAVAHGMDYYIAGGAELFRSQGGNCSNAAPGGPGPTCNQVVYWLQGTWRWPALQGIRIASGSINVLGTMTGSNACISIDSLEMTYPVDLVGMQLACSTAGAALLFAPQNPTPLDGGVGIAPADLHFGSIVNSSTGLAVEWLNSNGGTSVSTFSFGEVLAVGAFAMEATSSGIYQFYGNTINAPFIHVFTNTGVIAGTAAWGGGNCLNGFGGNTWNIGLGGGVNTSRGVDSHACGDTYNIGYLANQAAGTLAIVNDVYASGNTYNLGAVQSGAPTFTDLSFAANSRVNYRPVTFSSAAVTLGASPFNSPAIADVAAGVGLRSRTETVVGGTVSAIKVGSVIGSSAITAVAGNPMQVTTTGTLNIPTNTWVLIQNVGGCTAANGYWQATNVSTTQFTLQGSGACNFAYTSAGGATEIGYQTTGATAGMFQLNPDQFLQVTYSVLPTMGRIE